MRTRLLLLLALPMLSLCVPVHGADDGGLQVIPLQYRNPQEMLRVLAPLVAPDGSVSAYENQLIVRATPAQMAEVRRVLAAVDQPPRQLLISVKQDEESALDRRGAGISGQYERGDGKILIPRADGRLPSRAEIELQDQHSSTRTSGNRQLRTEEGREAQIFLGQSLPYQSRYHTGDDGSVIRTEYRDAGSGFTVLPRLQGSRVQLEISLKQQVPGAGGTFNIQSTSSTVSGPLGEWFDIGSAVQQVTQSASGLLYGEHDAGSEVRRIMVKVEEVR